MATASGIRAGRAFVELFVDDSKLVRGLRRAQAKLKAFGRSVSQMGRQLLTAGTLAATPFALSARTFANFESQMARVRALTGAQADDFARLEEAAKRLGATTVFSASQAAEAKSYFALAGFDVEKILGAIGPTLDLAAAGQIEIAQAADIAAKIMAGMGLSADELGNAVDVMAKAMTTANTDLMMLGDAFKFVGPMAKTAGVSLEEVTAAIQLLSNAGIQGEMAGTTLRGMLLSLTAPSAEAEKELDRLGVRVLDSAGNVRSLTEIIADLENALAGAGSGEKLRSLGTIFPARQAAGAAELVSQGADRLREATEALGDASKCQVQVNWLREYDRLPVKRRFAFAPHVNPPSDKPRIELIGPVDTPGGNGPSNGMHALQKELRKRIDEGLDWLTIKSLPASRDAIPWFWNWADRRYAAWWDSQGLPFVQGPNMLFLNSATPRIDAEECALLDATNCRAMFCHSQWYRDLIAKHRGPASQSPIIMWPYPIDPWPGKPLPDEYDLLIYAKNGHRPMLLEHLAELFPRHIQIHYGQYHREQLFEAARRSRACAYLADDDHGPLALQEILLAGCPTVGVRTGGSFVRTGETGVVVDRLPPGRQCAESDEDVRALAIFMEAIELAQAMDRHSVRESAAEEFDTDRIVDDIITALNKTRLRGGIATAAGV